MSMYEDIKNFHKQFEYQPVIENVKRLALGKVEGFIIAGMGGSHLSADLIKVWRPDFPLQVWMNYGLPPLPKKELKESLIIASSYSGNTEETISVLVAARKNKLAAAVVSSGGKLIRMAKKYKIPYVEMPKMGIQPRLALGQSLKALFALMGEKKALREVSLLSKTLKPARYEAQGRNLARVLRGDVPIIYASERNRALAYNWKIKFNETGKIPAFYNVLPELNHNEMTGFDVIESTKQVSKNIHFVFLKDNDDHPRIIKRMNILEGLYRDRGFNVEVFMLRGNNAFEKIFSSLVLADWASYFTAKFYGAEPEQVPMVEEFKRLIR